MPELELEASAVDLHLPGLAILPPVPTLHRCRGLAPQWVPVSAPTALQAGAGQYAPLMPCEVSAQVWAGRTVHSAPPMTGPHGGASLIERPWRQRAEMRLRPRETSARFGPPLDPRPHPSLSARLSGADVPVPVPARARPYRPVKARLPPAEPTPGGGGERCGTRVPTRSAGRGPAPDPPESRKRDPTPLGPGKVYCPSQESALWGMAHAGQEGILPVAGACGAGA